MKLPSIVSARTGTAVPGIARAFVLGFALASASSLAAAADAPPSAAMRELEVRDAWVRWLPSELPEAGYLTLINRSDRPIELTAVSSDAYRETSLHRSVTQDGMSRMQPVSTISVPAHATLRFADAGYHIMLMHPAHALAPGEHVPLTLHFGNGASRTVSFEVRAPNGSAPAQGDMKGMPGMPDMPGMHSTLQTPRR